jgi:NADH-quinone oxidoreductase subunit G
LRNVGHLVALDHLANSTTEAAELVLPAGTFAESDGTLVSSEGRAQRFFQVFDPSTDVQASWRWLRQAAAAAGIESRLPWEDLDSLTIAIAASMDTLSTLSRVAPARRTAGKIAREPWRYSGRTAMLANISVHEPKPPDDPDSALSFSMESGPGIVPTPLKPFFWAPGWNSVQAVNKFQVEIGGPLHGGDPGVRLIEPVQRAPSPYFSSIPRAFQSQAGEWLLIPVFHIFGSEELSRHAPAIAQLVPRQYLALNPTETAAIGVTEGEQIKVVINDSEFELKVTLRADLPRGLAGVAAGMPPFDGLPLPTFCKLAPVETLSTRGTL